MNRFVGGVRSARARGAHGPVIGESHHRLGGDRLAAGAGRFVADVRVPGMLQAAVLRSRHAHARLVSIDAKRALELPGVRAVLTAADVPAHAVIPNRVGAPPGTERYLQPAIARGVVRYVGEPVALVVADDRYVAEDALALIDVVYDPLPVCASSTQALAPGAPLLFTGTESNNVAVITMRRRRHRRRALERADLVIRERFVYPRQTAAALETRGLVAVPPDPRGGELHLVGSTKCIHINRGILAPIFGMPLGALRLTEVDVGGGFGVRGELYPEDILVPLAAMKLGRPVQWIEDRRESLMATNHARQVEYQAEIGFDREGRIVGLRALIHADIGAYVRTAALVPAEFGAALFPGPYRVPSYHCDLWSVVTNKTPAGTLRSPGRPECNFARERLMDLGAARLGLDPAEIRRRNLIRADEMPYDCGTKSFGASTVYDSGDFPALFDELLRRIDYEGARAEQAARNRAPRAQARHRARGVRREDGTRPLRDRPSSRRDRTAASPSTPARRRWAPASRPCSRRSLGESLGLPTHRFDVRHADTSHVESGVGTYGSRGTVTAGNAAAMAAAQAHCRGARAGRCRVGRARVRGDVCRAASLEAGSRRMTLAELAAQQRLAAGASFTVPKITYAGCAVGGHRRRGRGDGRGAARAHGHRGRRGARRESRPRRRAARGRRRLRHRQHAARDPRVRRGRAAPLGHAHGLCAAVCVRHASGRGLLPGSARDDAIRSACAASASAAIPAWAEPSPMPSAMRWVTAGPASPCFLSPRPWSGASS